MAKQHKQASNFNTGFRNIQNIIRRFNPLSILRESLAYIYSPTKNELEQSSKQPWLVMLTIKWTFLDPLVKKHLARPDITRKEMLDLLQSVLDLTDTGSMPDEFDDVRLFMRALAYQQFFHQTDNGLFDLARQKLLFGKVPENHYFKKRFLNRTGVTVDDFLLLAFALLATVKNTGPIVPRPYLFDAIPAISPMVVHAFLNLVSVDINDLHHELTVADTEGRNPDEYLRQTPFLRFPLIKVNAEYWCVSPYVLARSIGHFIYDLLKRDDVNRFNFPFGKAFEQYVGECIKNSGLAYAKEKEIEKELGGEGNLVDFIVVDGDVNILVDAKGVEMAQSGMTALKRGDVRRATKTSLIKAYEQGHDVAARLTGLKTNHPVIRQRTTTYLLAVTYKELYIGNGLTLNAMAGDTELEKIRAIHSEDSLIPAENIYFLTISEFEELTSLVSDGSIGLAQALEMAKKADSQLPGHKFTFELHINEWLRTKKLAKTHPLKGVLRSMLDDMRAR